MNIIACVNHSFFALGANNANQEIEQVIKKVVAQKTITEPCLPLNRNSEFSDRFKLIFKGAKSTSSAKAKDNFLTIAHFDFDDWY